MCSPSQCSMAISWQQMIIIMCSPSQCSMAISWKCTLPVFYGHQLKTHTPSVLWPSAENAHSQCSMAISWKHTLPVFYGYQLKTHTPNVLQPSAENAHSQCSMAIRWKHPFPVFYGYQPRIHNNHKLIVTVKQPWTWVCTCVPFAPSTMTVLLQGLATCQLCEHDSIYLLQSTETTSYS